MESKNEVENTTQNSATNQSKTTVDIEVFEEEFRELLTQAKEEIDSEGSFDTLGTAFQFAEDTFNDFFENEEYYEYREELYQMIAEHISDYVYTCDLDDTVSVYLCAWDSDCFYLSVSIYELYIGDYVLPTRYYGDMDSPDDTPETILYAIAEGLHVNAVV